MSVQTCLKKLQDYVKESGLDKNISKDRLEIFARQLEMAGADSATPAEFKAKARIMFEESQDRLAAQLKAAKAMSILKYKNGAASVKTNIETWRGEGMKDPAIEAMRVFIEGGSLNPGIGTNMDTKVMARAVEAQLRAVNRVELDPLGDAPKGGLLDKEALQVIEALNNKTSLEGMKNEAIAYGKAVKTIQNNVLQEKMAINPFMEKSESFLSKGIHNREKITADPTPEGKAKWLAQVMDAYGKESFPFNTPDEKLGIFAKMYDKINDGTFGTVLNDSIEDKWGERLNGVGGKIMTSMAQSADLIPESAEKLHAYQKLYGDDTLYQTLDKVTRKAARDIAVLNKWGALPETTLDGVYKDVLKSLSGQEAINFRNAKPQFDKAFRVQMGAQDAPASVSQAKVVRAGMDLEYIAKGSMGGIKAGLLDPILGAGLMRTLNGKNIFSNLADVMGNMLKNLPKTDANMARMERLGMMYRGASRELLAGMGGEGSKPGAIGKAASLMGTYSAHDRISDSLHLTYGEVVAKFLGEFAHLPFEELPVNAKDGIQRYNFTPDGWNVARLGVETLDGEKALTPAGIRGLPDEAVENYLRRSRQYVGKGDPSERMLNNARSQLAMQAGVMINEHASLGSAEAGSRQRTFMYGDTNINGGLGQALRMAWQFKAPALTSLDVYRRVYLSGQGPRGDLAGVAHMVVSSLVFGASAIMLKNIAQGKTTNVHDPKFWAESALTGGAAGLWGDTLVNAMSQGRTISDKVGNMGKTLMGPAPDDFLTAAMSMGFGAYGAATHDEAMRKDAGRNLGDLGANAARVGAALIPGVGPVTGAAANFPFMRAAFNYYIGNEIHEQMSRGYVHQLTQSAHRHGQEYLFGKPTSSSFFQGD